MEASLLGAFMASACVFCVLIEYPHSPVRLAIAEPAIRRLFMGFSMGLTAIAIIYSPWGKQSGAHINPSVSLAFFRLGRIHFWDTVFYIAAQFAGASLGMLSVASFLRRELADPAIEYAITIPGPRGPWVAFVAEFILSFGMMYAVLGLSGHQRLGRYTGLVVGLLLVIFITFEAPFSGMSINPARTFGSAVTAHVWTGFWIYVLAPTLGMLAAAEFYLWSNGRLAVKCCKLHHANAKRCVFCGANGGFTS
jgi:aquaporin Z